MISTVICISLSKTGTIDLASKWVRLAANGTSPGLFVLKSDLKKSQICPICGQSDPIRKPNLTNMTYSLVAPAAKVHESATNAKYYVCSLYVALMSLVDEMK